ncbi:MAG: helix-turn-helix domain-containing protein [Sandaracinaceae bacterium]
MVHELPPRKKKTARAKRREETSAAIVEAALAIVTEEGFDALTMKRLADELGYAIGAFYRYFPSKDALLLAVQRRVLELLAEELAEARRRLDAHLAREPASEQVAALARIVALAQVYETLPTRRPAHFRLLSRWLGEPEPMVGTEAAAPAMPVLLALFGSVPALLVEAEAVGALRPGDVSRRGNLLWGALQGVLQLRKLDRFGVDAFRPGPLAQELYRTVLLGWGADPARVDAALALAAEVLTVQMREEIE